MPFLRPHFRQRKSELPASPSLATFGHQSALGILWVNRIPETPVHGLDPADEFPMLLPEAFEFVRKVQRRKDGHID